MDDTAAAQVPGTYLGKPVEPDRASVLMLLAGLIDFTAARFVRVEAGPAWLAITNPDIAYSNRIIVRRLKGQWVYEAYRRGRLNDKGPLPAGEPGEAKLCALLRWVGIPTVRPA